MKRQTILALFALLFAASMTVVACKKDDDKSACQKLEGEWKCVSFKEDGVELLGSAGIINSSELDFDKLNGDEGDFDWTITYNDGSNEALRGDYEVNANCTEVTMTPVGEIGIDFDFEIDGDELTLEANLDGSAAEVKFKRD